MATPDDIRSGLSDAATSIDVGDLDTARADVHRVVRRRRARVRIGAGLGVTALVIAGAVAVSTGPDEPDRLVSVNPTVVEAPDDTVVTDASTSPAEPATTAPAAVVLDRAGVEGASAGQNGAPEFSEWMTPWRDGFLVGSYVYPPQPLPEQLPDDVRALFPQEVLDLFADGLPATIAEATDMLSEAGLLDEVSTIISEHPEASAIYGEPVATAPTVDARFTTDGVTWEPVEMTLPPGSSYLSSVGSVGDRLVVAVDEPFAIGTEAAPSGTRDTLRIATTTDLTNWTIQEIGPTAPPIEFPDGIERSLSAQGLVANDSGWAVTVYESIQPDVAALLPDDVRERLESAGDYGYGTSYDDSGVVVESYGDDGSPLESIRYTWDELGIGPDVVAYLSGNEFRPQVWASTWEGAPALSDGLRGSGLLVATDAGFLQWDDQTWFSPDGLAWTASPLPLPDGQVSAAVAFDGGVIAAVVEADGSAQLYRLDERGGAPVRLDLPGIPDMFQAGFGSSWGTGSVLIVDAAVPDPPPPLVVEVEGYRLEVDQRVGTVTLTDVASGEVVVSEPGPWTGAADSAFSFDEAGLTVTDPATGEVVVVIPAEVMTQADQAASEDVGREYVQDLWLVATGDGEGFVVVDLDDDGGEGWPILAAASGDAALVFAGGSWVRYELS